MARKHQNGGVVGEPRMYSGSGNQTGVYDMQTVYDHFSGAPTNREGYNNGSGTTFAKDVTFFARGGGGGGGSNYSGGANGLGGNGGLAEGTLLNVQIGTVFYVMVGEGGGIGPGGTAYGGGAQPGNGNFYGGTGGGATSVHIINNSELSTLFNSQANVVIVGGGGGGGGNTSYGGSGGGTSGLSANATGVQFGSRTGGAGGGPSPTSLSFGQGGFTGQNLAGGGGGGWQGGGGGANSTGGGGGSGYAGFAGNAGLSLPALSSTSQTVGGGSTGGLGQQTLTGNNPGSPGTGGSLVVFLNGVFSQTFNYTGAMQTLTIA